MADWHESLQENRDKPDDNQVYADEIVENLGKDQNNDSENEAGNTKECS